MAVQPVQQGQDCIVQVEKKNISLLEDPAFERVKDTAKTWLSNTSASPTAREMDSVFFNSDRFELIVDVRGYRPEDIKCTVNTNTLEVTAERHETSAGSERNMATKRSYQLPQPVIPTQATCAVSSEGILLIAVPWQK